MHTPTLTHKNAHTKQNSELPCQRKKSWRFSLCIFTVYSIYLRPKEVPIHSSCPPPTFPSLPFPLLSLSSPFFPWTVLLPCPCPVYTVILCISIQSRTHKWEKAFHACFSKTGLIHVIWLSPVASTSLQTSFFPMAENKRNPLYIQTTFSPSSPRWRTSIWVGSVL